MDIALDRRGLLLDQLDTTTGLASERLAGLTDAEYLLEPVAGMWSVRPRGSEGSAHPFGPGGWQLDNDLPVPNPALHR
jgi:hypothetical protein